MQLLKKLKRYFLFLFIFSIPFQYWDPWGISSFFTITKMLGLIYFALSLVNLRRNFTLKYCYNELKPIFGLLLWLALISFFYYTDGVTFSIFNLTFLQSIVLFWLISNEFSQDPQDIKFCWLWFIFGTILMSVLIKMGIGLGVNYDLPLGETRVTFFGANPNSIGNWAAISIILIISMIFEKRHFFGKKAYLLLLCIPNLILMLGASGSRGAFVVLFVGLVLFFLFYKTSIKRKLPIFILGIIIMFYLGQLILRSNIMQSRLESSQGEESLGGRIKIWETAFFIFGDSPIWGYGETGYQMRMIQDYGIYKNTHNIILYFMVTGGVIGMALYLLFLYRAFRNSVYKLKRDKIVLPLCLLVICIATGFKDGGFLSEKLMWIILAYASCRPGKAALRTFRKKVDVTISL